MHPRALLLWLSLLGVNAVVAAGQAPPTAGHDQAPTLPSLSTLQQIAAAVLPLPATLRDGAGVIAFSKDASTYRTLRKSTNGFMCFGPSGGESTFDARCFHGDVFPLFARFYALAGQQLSADDIDRRIEAEIKAGKISLPTRPVASYLMRGPATAFDVSTGKASSLIKTWQTIETPRQTGATLGLPEEAVPGSTMPFVMQAGTVWAHIMVIQP